VLGVAFFDIFRLSSRAWRTADSTGTFHAIWVDSNNVQNVVWFYGFHFVPTRIHQQNVVTGTGP
jgi:hypothetical protein